MRADRKSTVVMILVMILSGFKLTAQISPGDLSNPHSHLEGLSNCTQCHVIGNKVTNEKCLVCHTEIQSRISSLKGYHVSDDVKGKQCFACHSEHNGKNFQLVRLDIAKFNHSLTGYALTTPHSKKECKDCHNTRYITDQKVRNKKFTYLGVNTTCLNCHADYHRTTLSQVCTDCHNPEAFKPASKFNHSNARFQLAGKHKNVDCLKCHRLETIDGKKFQEFRGVQFSNCNNCHKDPHKNQFGQNCRQCHSEESFLVVTGVKNFDHSKTHFKLEEKHLNVSCKACHKAKLTDPVKYDQCTDCHADYHNRQFAKNGISPDCSQCHTVKGFTLFSYSVDQHNAGPFPLKGSHLALPCFECHKKQEKWNFRGIGRNCKDCHRDIHLPMIQAKYYPESDCRSCHNESRWTAISFDHSKTAFSLTGGHAKQDCRACHFKKDPDGIARQKFSGLSGNCAECHKDNHYRQFEKNGITDCTQCHGTGNWKAEKFDHNNTAFKLDGKHIGVPCSKCHKPEQQGSSFYVKYKLKEFKCESCHSSSSV